MFELANVRIADFARSNEAAGKGRIARHPVGRCGGGVEGLSGGPWRTFAGRAPSTATSTSTATPTSTPTPTSPLRQREQLASPGGRRRRPGRSDRGARPRSHVRAADARDPPEAHAPRVAPLKAGGRARGRTPRAALANFRPLHGNSDTSTSELRTRNAIETDDHRHARGSPSPSRPTVIVMSAIPFAMETDGHRHVRGSPSPSRPMVIGMPWDHRQH
jgi:hypothetical protein